MTRLRFATVLLGASLAAWTVASAQGPNALAQASPGLWEIAGVPGANAAARQCLGDVAALAQYEHREQSCARRVISSNANSAVIEYSCPAGGFGRGKVTVITPRSLRVETQGISNNLPFHYVLQARRVGDCPGRSTASRH